MTKNIIGTLMALAALVSPMAHAIPPSVAIININLGTVFSGTSSGLTCTPTTLPANLDQVFTYQSSGQVSFGRAYTVEASGNGAVDVCVNVSYDLSAFGPFSGSEVITLGGYMVTINANGNYQ